MQQVWKILKKGLNALQVCDYIIKFLSKYIVKDVFMLTGGGAMHLNNSCIDKVNVVCMQHEHSLAFAVEAYAKAYGFGVGIVTSGPGSTNCVTGVASAWLDSVPCLFISGNGSIPKADNYRQIGIQEINIVDIVKPITKYAVQITDPRSIKKHLHKAIEYAFKDRAGPVWIDIPLNVQCADCSR